MGTAYCGVVSGTLACISSDANSLIITCPPEVVIVSDIPPGILRAVAKVSGSPRANTLYGLLIGDKFMLIPLFVSLK
jgi:hypothetical protein